MAQVDEEEVSKAAGEAAASAEEDEGEGEAAAEMEGFGSMRSYWSRGYSSPPVAVVGGYYGRELPPPPHASWGRARGQAGQAAGGGEEGQGGWAASLSQMWPFGAADAPLAPCYS